MQNTKSQSKIQNYLELKAQKYADKIIKLPFITMVALTGSVVAGKADNESDIDYFIQIEKGRLYVGRLLVTLIVHLWGQRRTDKNIAGKLCLNWYGTSNLPKQRNYQYILLAKSTPMRTKVLDRTKVSWLLDKLLEWVESMAKNYQIVRFKKDPRTHTHGSEVRWSDDELGFHPKQG